VVIGVHPPFFQDKWVSAGGKNEGGAMALGAPGMVFIHPDAVCHFRQSGHILSAARRNRFPFAGKPAGEGASGHEQSSYMERS
jgi:hypothetical protein